MASGCSQDSAHLLDNLRRFFGLWSRQLRCLLSRPFRRAVGDVSSGGRLGQLAAELVEHRPREAHLPELLVERGLSELHRFGQLYQQATRGLLRHLKCQARAVYISMSCPPEVLKCHVEL